MSAITKLQQLLTYIPISLKTLEGEFDLIFVDANKDGYAAYVQTILDQKLLSSHGVILCDNGKPDTECCTTRC